MKKASETDSEDWTRRRRKRRLPAAIAFEQSLLLIFRTRKVAVTDSSDSELAREGTEDIHNPP